MRLKTIAKAPSKQIRGAFMDRRSPASPSRFLHLLLFLLLFCLGPTADGTGVFRVRHKFPGRRRHLADLRAHDDRRHAQIFSSFRHPTDTRRHSRSLSTVDLPIGGLGVPTDTGLYFAQIGIGTPPKDYYVQVDTGSDIMWVDCISCRSCPQKSNLKIELTQYDLKGTKSGGLVSCEEGFCSSMYGNQIPGCTANIPCPFKITYGDGSLTSGFFVSDYVQYDQVSGNHQTTPVNASVTFGCATELSGDLRSSEEALDGIIGFGQSNSSMISQLASSGKVSKVFAHCLDTTAGGGIFAIGRVVQPKVKTTPLVSNQPHYNVNLKAIDVGGAFLQLPTDLFETGNKKGTIIDSGTTLAYIPDAAFQPLMSAIFADQSSLKFFTVQDFICFHYSGSVDDGFPHVTFHFENSVPLVVYAHDYLFENEDGIWCVGWQNSAKQSKDGESMVLLGDLALSNKLVLYDLENQVIGWTDYNCSSSIKVQDDKTGAVYSVDAHNISSADESEKGSSIILLLLTAAMCYLIS